MIRPLRPPDLLCALALVVLLALMPLLAFDFGITWDEPIQNHYGNLVYEYFRSGFHDTAALSYFNLHYYGGFFDLACVVFQKIFPSLDPFDARHILNSLFGWLAICITGLTARKHFGALAGLLAVLFLSLAPRFFADCMNNPKDLPFAVFATLALAALLNAKREFPFYSLRAISLFVLAAALAINIRVGGMLFLGYAGLALGVLLFYGRRQLTPGRVVATGLCFAGCCLAAIVLGTVFWPWAHVNPLLRPFQALEYMSHFSKEMVASRLLYAGQWLPIDQTPWHYMPRWIAITTPIAILAGAPAALLRYRNHAERGAIGLIIFATLFPVFYIIATRAAVYDGARHLLFVIPPLAILAAAGWSRLFELVQARRAALVALVLLFAVSWYDPIRFVLANHPNQNVYFNPLVGGIKGAFLRYDLDYWNNSFKQAIDWLNKTATDSGQPLAFSTANGNVDAPGLYSRRFPALRYVPRLHPRSRRVLYVIILMRGAPNEIGPVLSLDDLVYAVTVDEVPICLIRRMEAGLESE